MAAAMFAFMSEAFYTNMAGEFHFIGSTIRLNWILHSCQVRRYPRVLEHQKWQERKFSNQSLIYPVSTSTFKAFAVASLNATAFYLIFSYMPNYLATELGVNKTQAFISGSISLLFYIAVVLQWANIQTELDVRKCCFGQV